MIHLLIMGFVFILIVFSFRFFAYKSMTQKVCSLEPDNAYCRKHYKKKPYYRCNIERNQGGGVYSFTGHNAPVQEMRQPLLI
jgi:hypothetical protein